MSKNLRFILGFALSMFAAASAQFPKAVVDPASAERGAKLYGSNCARCHGDDARGTTAGPDMIRSEAVLRDRREALHGRDLGPLLRTIPQHNFKFSDKENADLSQFLTLSINKILRSGYNDQPTNLLSGDAKAGEAYFNGAGGCSRCHSPTGNLAGVGKKYTTAALQQKFLFPGSGIRGATKLLVTVKLHDGKTYSGDVVRIDDFNVTLRSSDGISHSFSRTPGTVVTVVHPFAAHEALLDQYTDADIHNLTAYLDTLK
ncbi:c-type cytochrome [Terriglobus roseus]|uniref:Cytochrome c n=1 Tax=Terriglobus roseus TaxID=392734 RepID=A0A1G7GNE4_9BACT|nr:c-type cytochrome [Terriglobus roseus]SDE89675.1 Cytochrome c [Terriglobus roseus]